MKRLTTILFFVSVTHFLWAQVSEKDKEAGLDESKSIFGTVSEYHRPKVITDASLWLKDPLGRIEPIQKKSNTYSGYFELAVPNGFDTLIITKAGYDTIQVDIRSINGLIPDESLKLRRVLRIKLQLADEQSNDLVTSGLTISRYINSPKGPNEKATTLIKADQQIRDELILKEQKAPDDTSSYDRLLVSSEIYQQTERSIKAAFEKSDQERLNFELDIKLQPVPKLFSQRGISTAGKRDQKILDIPASVVIINKEDIAAQGYQTVAEILENITGLYTFRDYSWSGGDPIIGMRGFFSQGFNNDLIILVNGVNQYQDYWGFYPFGRFPIAVEAIDRIEIVRGPMSVLYGSGAFFGAINIITNATPEEDLSDSALQPKHLAISYGSRDTKRISGGLKYKKDRVNFSFNANVSSTDGLDQPFSRFLHDTTIAKVNNAISTNPALRSTTQQILPRDQRYISASLSLQDKAGLTQYSVDITASSEDRGIFESTAASSNTFCNCPIPQANPDATASINRTTSTYGGFQVNHQPDSTEINLNLSLFFHDFRTEIDYSSGGNRFGQSSFLSKAFEMEISASNTWKEKFSGIIGFNARIADDLFTSFDLPAANFLDGNNYRQLDGSTDLSFISGFGEFAYELTDNLAFTGGLRVEKLSNFKYLSNPTTDTLNNLAIPPISSSLIDPSFVMIPRGALVWTLNTTNSLKFLFGEARKRPSFGNYTDNANLTFPVIRTYELNFIRESTKESGVRSRWNASVYYNEITGLISRISTVEGNQSVFFSSNARDVNTFGAEVGVVLLSNDENDTEGVTKNNWSVEISGSLNRSDESQKLREGIVVDNAAPSYSPLFLGYFKGVYTWNLEKVNISAAFNMRYISKVRTEFELGEQTNPVRIGSDVPAYLLSNINIRASNFTGKLLKNTFVSFNISNLTDAEVQYPTTGNNSSWATQGSPGFGRRFFVTIGINI